MTETSDDFHIETKNGTYIVGGSYVKVFDDNAKFWYIAGLERAIEEIRSWYNSTLNNDEIMLLNAIIDEIEKLKKT